MRSTKSTVVKGKDGVYVRGEVWSKERYRKDMDRRNKYNRETYRQVQVRLRRDTAPDILNWVTLVSNFNEYVRDLIRADLQKRIKRGEIAVDDQTGAVTVLKKPAKLDISGEPGDVSDSWNLESLPEGAADIYSIKLKAGPDKKKKDTEEEKPE